MRRLLAMLLLLMTLLPLTAFGETSFDMERLLAVEDLNVFVDDNGTDTVYRFPDPTLSAVCDDPDTEVFALLDLIDLAQEGLIAPRLTLSCTSFAPLNAQELCLDFAGKRWRFPVLPATYEYDAVYYEDYGICFSKDALPLLKAMARAGSAEIPFSLETEGEPCLTGVLTLPDDHPLAERYQLFLDCRGAKQPLDTLSRRWPVEIEKLP